MRSLVRLLFSMLLFCAAVAFAAPRAPAPLPIASHPILGVWLLMLPDGSCMETYRFRGDGTTLVTSAEEVSESAFTIPDKPSAKGYYRLDDTIVKDNGKRDCTGSVMAVGTKVTNFVLFHPSGQMFLLCSAESMDHCIGPFRRVQGETV